MWQALNARSPFLTKKRSFDLAWGAWAGILAVMTAVGAALTGSQILMMYPRPASMLVFKYPSLPKATHAATRQLKDETLTLFWSQQGVIVGHLSELAAPVKPGQLVVKQGTIKSPRELKDEIEGWSRKNISSPIRQVAVGQSLRGKGLNFSQMAELVGVIEEINEKVFAAEDVVPEIVPLDLLSPM